MESKFSWSFNIDPKHWVGDKKYISINYCGFQLTRRWSSKLYFLVLRKKTYQCFDLFLNIKIMILLL